MPRPPRPSTQLLREEDDLKRRQLRRERLLRRALAALAAVPCSPAALRFQKHLGRLWPLRVAIGVVAALFMARDAERREGRGGEGLSFQAWRAGVAGRGSRSGSAAAAGLDGVSGRPEEQGQSPTMLRGRPWRWEAARSRGQASHHPG